MSSLAFMKHSCESIHQFRIERFFRLLQQSLEVVVVVVVFFPMHFNRRSCCRGSSEKLMVQFKGWPFLWTSAINSYERPVTIFDFAELIRTGPNSVKRAEILFSKSRNSLASVIGGSPPVNVRLGCLSSLASAKTTPNITKHRIKFNLPILMDSKRLL